MLDWLRGKRQSPRAIQRFWRPVLVSAVNEELDRMAAAHGFQVMWLGFLASRRGYELGVPQVPLGELCHLRRWSRWPEATVELHAAADHLVIQGDRVVSALVNGTARRADFYVLAVPFHRLPELAPEVGFDPGAWEYSPITAIHLWFDRPVTELPHAALLDRTIQWFFSKEDGRYLQAVVSASRRLLRTPRSEVAALAARELAEFLPGAREARLERYHVVKEVRATFSARPGLAPLRPPAETRFRNLFLAGAWTRTGWPATMEGAVRSGYLAAEAVSKPRFILEACGAEGRS